MNLDDMTFDTPEPYANAVICAEHGADCIGHAWRVEP